MTDEVSHTPAATDLPGRRRQETLIDGRRVTLKDLVDGGLLAPDEELRFRWAVAGETRTATVTHDGHLILDDGQRFANPSRAGRETASVVAVNGWQAWQNRAGKTLAELRSELFEPAPHGVGAATMPDQHAGAAGVAESELGNDASAVANLADLRAFLDQAASSKSDGHRPVVLTVRDLLGKWGFQRRGHYVAEQIMGDLEERGLTTEPDFRNVGLDTPIELVATEGPDPVTELKDLGEEPRTATSQPRDEFRMGLTLGNVPAAFAGVDSLKPDAPIERAVTTMMLNDVGHIAVMASERNLLGVVTWKSIARLLYHGRSRALRDATDPVVPISYDRHLIDVLPELSQRGFVYVQGHRNEITGVVTTADVVSLYGETVVPFFLIGEIDLELRDLIADYWTIGDVVAICYPDSQRPPRSHDDMTFGDYHRILADDERFNDLKWGLDRKAFSERLDEIRVVRNNVAHFGQDPVDDQAVKKLRDFLGLVRQMRR